MLEEIPFLAGLMAEVRGLYPSLDPSRFTHEIMRRQITRMIEDVISVAQQRLAELQPQSAQDIRNADRMVIEFSDAMRETDKAIKKMLFTRIYRHPEIMRIRKGAADIVTDLYKAFMADPKLMRKHHWYDHISELPEAAKARQVGDYLAGMTDTYAIATHRQLFDHTPDLR